MPEWQAMIYYCESVPYLIKKEEEAKWILKVEVHLKNSKTKILDK